MLPSKKSVARNGCYGPAVSILSGLLSYINSNLKVAFGWNNLDLREDLGRDFKSLQIGVI